ncbi:MAG TPA: hypothetical protein ENI87_06445 [bacterium]|nr:hypothetical protein [bacterium]
MRRFGVWTNLVLGGVLMLCVWALFVWAASRPALRVLIDLTPQRTNSVAPATEELLAELRADDAEVELHLFQQPVDGQGRDDATRQFLAIRSRLIEATVLLLRRYEALGGENVRLFQHSPYDDSVAFREAAEAFGYSASDREALVVAVRQPGQERRFRKLSLLSDLAVIELPQERPGPVKSQQVPVLKDFQGEKAISSALKSLLVQGTPVCYVLRGYDPAVSYDESMTGYGTLISALVKNGFEVRNLNLQQSPAVPVDATLVLCVEPRREFLPRHAEALFQYLQRGGRLFLNYSWTPAAVDMNPTGGRLGELLGYELSTKPVFHKIPDVANLAGGSIDGTEGVARLSMHVNPAHPTTRRLAESGSPFELMFARALRERAGAPRNVRREELMGTGNEGWLGVRDEYGQMSYRAPNVRLGRFTTGMVFEVDPVAAEGDDAGSAAVDARPGQAVILSGVFCNNAGFPFFGKFALNVCNWMAERRVLLDIASANYEVKSLDIKQPQLLRTRDLMTYYLPGAFLLLGLIVWWRRRH